MDAAEPVASSSGVLSLPHPCDDLSGVRVLLVDDERESRAVLTAMLSLLNASVVAVASAREALSALRLQCFDLLLSDIALVGRSGYELVRAVRALDPPIDSMPAIAVTGRVTPEDRAKARDAGFQAHVGKPIDMQALVQTIRGLALAPRGPAEAPLAAQPAGPAP
jgi:CheY-like chemotaxis protein